MNAASLTSPRRHQGGALMIEVLVTISIMVIGLWGLMEVQTRLQQSEMESYQRTQALLLLDDMASRVTANRRNAPEYVTASPLGVGAVCPGGASLADGDRHEWCRLLQGAAETSGDGFDVGALVGGRGCVDNLGGGEYLVSVVWQGRTPTAAPPNSVSCGAGLYDLPAGSDCATIGGDRCRRYVSTVVHIGTLLAVP